MQAAAALLRASFMFGYPAKLLDARRAEIMNRYPHDPDIVALNARVAAHSGEQADLGDLPAQLLAMNSANHAQLRIDVADIYGLPEATSASFWLATAPKSACGRKRRSIQQDCNRRGIASGLQLHTGIISRLFLYPDIARPGTPRALLSVFSFMRLPTMRIPLVEIEPHSAWQSRWGLPIGRGF
jgi:hypothetical protein